MGRVSVTMLSHESSSSDADSQFSSSSASVSVVGVLVGVGGVGGAVSAAFLASSRSLLRSRSPSLLN